ncbi:hypothetical protein D3C86_1909380 [compost metagenome]
MQGGAVFIGPGRQHRRALEQQERDGHILGQQGKSLDAGSGLGQQRVQGAVDVTRESDLLRMYFNGLDLLALQRIQAFIRHESGCHGSVLFPSQMSLGF